MFLYLLRDIGKGGNNWRQGDWLINNELAVVRRGPFGSLLLHLSDIIGISPLYLLVAFQALLFGVLFLTIIFVVLKIGLSDRLFLLMLSPGFLLFWLNDPEGSAHKELIGFAAFMPLLLVPSFPHLRRWLTYSAIAIFLLAVLAHEANVFLAPFFLIALWLSTESRRIDFEMICNAGTVIFASVLAAGYAVVYARVPDTMLVCQPLIDRGFDQAICNGAISFLNGSARDALAFSGANLLTYRGANLILAYGLALAPLYILLKDSPQGHIHFVAICASAIIFVPLYLVGVDWGRWINFHISAVVFLYLIDFQRHQPQWLSQPVAPRLKNMMVALCFLVGIRHVFADFQLGVIFSFWRAF